MAIWIQTENIPGFIRGGGTGEVAQNGRFFALNDTGLIVWFQNEFRPADQGPGAHVRQVAADGTFTVVNDTALTLLGTNPDFNFLHVTQCPADPTVFLVNYANAGTEAPGLRLYLARRVKWNGAGWDIGPPMNLSVPGTATVMGDGTALAISRTGGWLQLTPWDSLTPAIGTTVTVTAADIGSAGYTSMAGGPLHPYIVSLSATRAVLYLRLRGPSLPSRTVMVVVDETGHVVTSTVVDSPDSGDAGLFAENVLLGRVGSDIIAMDVFTASIAAFAPHRQMILRADGTVTPADVGAIATLGAGGDGFDERPMSPASLLPGGLKAAVGARSHLFADRTEYNWGIVTMASGANVTELYVPVSFVADGLGTAPPGSATSQLEPVFFLSPTVAIARFTSGIGPVVSGYSTDSWIATFHPLDRHPVTNIPPMRQRQRNDASARVAGYGGNGPSSLQASIRKGPNNRYW